MTHVDTRRGVLTFYRSRSALVYQRISVLRSHGATSPSVEVRMFSKRFLSCALVAALSVTSACGGDDDDNGTGPNGTGDTPTAVEAANMMAALQAAFSFAGLFANPSDPTLALQTGQTFTVSNKAVACTGGGTVSNNGSYTYNLNGNNFTYSGSVTQQFSNCKSSGGGQLFTFNGQGLTMTFNYSTTSTGFNYTFRETGNINWAGNNRGGTCPIDFTVTASSSSTGATSSVTGSYCGISLTQ